MPQPNPKPFGAAARRGLSAARTRTAYKAIRRRLAEAAGSDDPATLMAQAMIEAIDARQFVTEEDLLRMGFTRAEIRAHGRAACDQARAARRTAIREAA